MSWHLADVRHDVVFVTVDIKSSGGSKETFPDEIDNYMREWFNAGIMYTPGQLTRALEPARVAISQEMLPRDRGRV